MDFGKSEEAGLNRQYAVCRFDDVVGDVDPSGHVRQRACLRVLRSGFWGVSRSSSRSSPERRIQEQISRTANGFRYIDRDYPFKAAACQLRSSGFGCHRPVVKTLRDRSNSHLRFLV